MPNIIVIKRIVAYLIDAFIVSLVATSLTYLPFFNPKYEAYQETFNNYQDMVTEVYSGDLNVDEMYNNIARYQYEIDTNGYVYIIGNIVIVLLYYGVFAYVTKGQTLGKKLLGIKIVSNTDKQLKIWNYFIRAIILNGILMNIITLIAINFKESTYLQIYSYASNFNLILTIVIILTILFTKENRGLHDIIARTRVISAK